MSDMPNITASTGLHSEPLRTGKGKRARLVSATAVAPIRSGKVWSTVTVEPSVENMSKTQPKVSCKNCGKQGFTANYSRLVMHIIGSGGGISACNPVEPSAEFVELKKSLVEEEAKKQKKRERTNDEADVDEASGKVEVSQDPQKVYTQMSMGSSFKSASAQMCDDAIADFFYGDNIPDAVVESPRFRRMVQTLKLAPVDYQPPRRNRLGNDMLLSATQRLMEVQAPLKKALLNHCGTMISDGWDDVERNHLINFLVGTSKGMFFEGTVELQVRTCALLTV